MKKKCLHCFLLRSVPTHSHCGLWLPLLRATSPSFRPSSNAATPLRSQIGLISVRYRSFRARNCFAVGSVALSDSIMLNRSFRAPESQRTSMTHQSPTLRREKSLGAVIKEKDEELALFLEMRKREKERNTNLLLLSHNPEELDRPPGSKAGSSPIFKINSSASVRKTGPEDFLSTDADKNDYDWLLTPPGTPLFPSLEKESKRSPAGHIGTPKTRPTALKSRLANSHEPITRSNSISRQPTSSSSSSSSFPGTRRPSSSCGPGSVSSRPATPTSLSTLHVTSKPSRSSTPTSRITFPSKQVIPPRSATPTRSSTPTSRSSALPANKPVSRAATPTRRSSAPSSIPARNLAAPIRSSSTANTAPVTSKTLVPSRGSSPTVKSRPVKPLEILPGFSLDAPPNLRTSLPERPTSASRGRPGAPTSRSSSVDAGSGARPRRQSCSPSRGRAPNGSVHSGGSVPAIARSRLNNNDNLNPVLMGNKMVERVINSRRLAPPKQDDPRSRSNKSGVKSSLCPSSDGFGRNLSKKSLDMAMRHMDIRRSIPNNLRPLMTNIPASSMYSVRSGSSRNRGISVSDSPLATSSNASSEQSVGTTNMFVDGNELEDYDIRIVKANISSPSTFLTR